MLRLLMSMAVLVGSALFLACGSGDDAEPEATPTPVPSVTEEATAAATPTRAPTVTPEPTEIAEVTVSVTLREYEIVTDADSGPPGKYTFAFTNEGPAEEHVFMIVQTDLPPDELPLASTGQFVSSDDAVILANTPGIDVGGTDVMVYELEAGNYVFICSKVAPGISDSGGEAHYSKGMRTGFTVE